MNACPVCQISTRFRLTHPDWATDGTGTIPTVERESRLGGTVTVHLICTRDWDWAHEHVSEEHSYVDGDGVIRWRSNDRVPFDDCLRHAEILAAVRARCAVARDAETRAFLKQYAESGADVMSDEEKAEARAAHGPGTELVNVITGRRTML